ncbi:hypothetical protein K2X89_07135 [Myxococcota bacterium]|nr:hypothetical protein [Myxococcota bacterium]
MTCHHLALVGTFILMATGCRTYIHGPLSSENIHERNAWPGPDLVVERMFIADGFPRGVGATSFELKMNNPGEEACVARGDTTAEIVHLMSLREPSIAPIVAAFFIPI